MGTRAFLTRMRIELADLERDPPPLVTCYPSDDDITQLEAYLNGPPNTPYEKGVFRLDVNMPESYPFDPPMIRFRTPIYHPNIDEYGRICASVLKKGKDDQWKPSMNLRTTLLSLHALIGAPNPDDPLDADIAREYQQDYDLFVKKAREHTKKYAVDMPDNLIPDPYAESTTHTTKTADMDFDNYPNDSDHILSTGVVEDTSIATSSKSKSKSKLSLSKKKQSDTQSTTLPSSSTQDSSENGVKSKATKGSDTNGPLTSQQKEGTSTQQQTDDECKNEKCDARDHSILSSPEFGSRNKATTKYESKTNDNKGDVLDQPGLRNLEDGSRNKDGAHDQESNDEKDDAMQQSSHEDEPTEKDAKYDDDEDGSNNQHGDTGNETRIDNQENQTKNDRGDTAKQVVYIDLDDETNDREQFIHDKTAYISSDESDNAERQTVVDVASGPNNKSDAVVEQGNHKDEDMDETSDNAADQCGLTSLPSSIDKLSEATSGIITNEMPTATSAAAASRALTPSTDKAPSPSAAIVVDSNRHSMGTTKPLSPLKTVTTDDTPGWAYTNHYSSRHLAFTTNDPFAEVFPAFEEEEEERLITPKRKSKLSLSCKKKHKAV